MDRSIVARLTSEIEELTGFFTNADAACFAPYGLDPSPISILFGPDIESFPTKNGQNIVNSDEKIYKSLVPPLMESIRARFARTNLHWPHDLASVQGNTIEIRLNPAGPGQICENYLDAIQLLHDSCADSGITLFPGNGHWHFSLNQGGKNCFKTLYDAGSLARLETAVCGSICDFQELLPALFVKPNIAEKDPLRGHGGPTDFMRGGSPSSSIRSSFDHYTWEPRLALHAPYQPVYLTLLSLRQAFTGDGGKIVSYDDPAYDGRVLRGTGGYLGMIRETLRTIDAHPALIPRPIALALLRESIRDYETYLAGPRAQLTMKPDAIAEIRENLRPIETLCAPAKIPSPAAPNL